MDGSRFDHLARALAGGASRRGVLGGLVGLAAGLVGGAAAEAQTCPPGRVSRRGLGCVCKATGRPPVGGVCPCPRGQTDTGDGQGCLACRSTADCPPSDACASFACVAGSCAKTTTVCPEDADPCTVAACDPTAACGQAPVPEGGACVGLEGVCLRGKCSAPCAGASTCVAVDATTCDCDDVLCFPDELREYSGTCTATVEGQVACTAHPFDLECGILPGCAGSEECPPGWVCVPPAGTLCCQDTGCYPILDQRLLPG